MTWQQTLDMERRLVRDEARAEAENAAKLLSLGVAAETVAEGCSLPLEQVLQMQKEQ